MQWGNISRAVVRPRDGVEARPALAALAACTACVVTAGCTPDIDTGRGTGDPPVLVGDDAAVPDHSDGGAPPGRDAGPGYDGGGGGDVDGGGVAGHEDHEVDVPLDADRPVDIMARSRLSKVASRMPHVADSWLHDVLESGDTMWYDHQSIVPGYQDSFGDNVTTPIGMRPNTIRRNLIDLAVPGGHAQIFQDDGVFHFPFGRPAISTEDDLAVLNWQLPRGGDGSVVPVVWWMREPNGLTHRIEWMFPEGTVLGEMLFVVDGSGEWWPFETRVRIRELDEWRVDLYRPFPTAAGFADALERKRRERPEWESSSEIDALIAHARDPVTPRAASLRASHIRGAFPAPDLAEDVLPALSDPTILRELLMEAPFRSARGEVWKSSGSLHTYAPTTDAPFSIVPRDYAGGFLEVNEESCSHCHRDAGRPFRDWYENITAYGELWGEDESFSWHPFRTSAFVDSSGRVVDFNYDNREMRSDFVSGGVLERYDRSRHPESTYRRLPGEWKDYAY